MSNQTLAMLLLFCLGCTVDYSPKPKGFNRIDLPVPSYQESAFRDYPFFFEHSAYSGLFKDTTGFTGDYWLDVYYPDFQANIQLTYHDIQNDSIRLFELINDSYNLASKHQIKAYSIDQTVLRTDNKITATIFELEGEVPSQCQFFATDSTRHFLRGALYFRTATQNDSLAPVIRFIKSDMVHLLNTLKWNAKP